MLIFDKALRNLLKLTLASTIIFLLFFTVSSVLDVMIKEKSYIPQKTIDGRGASEIKAIPNVINLKFTVKKTKKTLSNSIQDMQEVIKKALEVLERNNIKKNDIKTISYDTYPEYYKTNVPCDSQGCPSSKDVLKGFVALQTYSVKIRDIPRVSQIIKKLTDIGVEEVGELRFEIDSIEDVKYQARIQAIINAKKEAEIIAKSLNVKLKRIVKYRDEDNNHYLNEGMSLVIDKNPYSDIQPGEKIVRSLVIVSYEFE